MNRNLDHWEVEQYGINAGKPATHVTIKEWHRTETGKVISEDRVCLSIEELSKIYRIYVNGENRD